MLWTGTAGYLSYRGTSYRLPPEVARRLQGSFATMAGSAGAGRGAATVGQLGLHPVSWVVRPTVVGAETVGGTETTHIRASIDAAALVRDVATALARASALGALGGPLPASPRAGAEREQLAGRIRQGTFDVWTSTSDRTVRKLALALTVPGTGGGQGRPPGSWARVAFTLQYAGLGQPQTIVAPRAARPTAAIPPELAVELQSLDASVSARPASPR